MPQINSPINTIIVDRKDRFWYGTSDDGIFIKNSNRLNHLSNNSSFISTPINIILPDLKKRTWIGTAQEGLYLYDDLDRIISFNDPDLCPSQKITDLAHSPDDLLWIATEDFGIILLQEDDFTFYYLRSFDNKIKIGLNHIKDIEWASDRLWFVSKNLGLGWINFY